MHPFVSSCGSPSTTNPSGPIASTSRHLSASPNLTNPLLLLSLAVPRTHNYFACPTHVRCGILPHIGSMFFKGFKCIFPSLSLSQFSLYLFSLSLCFSCSVHCISLDFIFFLEFCLLLSFVRAESRVENYPMLQFRSTIRNTVVSSVKYYSLLYFYYTILIYIAYI